ncbi:MAG: EAL domain-containing protein [Pontibacterium sp.]
MSIKVLNDLLSDPLHATSVSTALTDATSIMRTHQLSSLLVIDAKKPVGIVTERDILNALVRNIPGDQPVSAVMSTPVLSAPATTEFRDGYHQLALHNIRHLLVTDSEGKPSGIVSESDFRNHLGTAFISRLKDIRGLMGSNTLTLPYTTPALSAIQTMAAHRFTCIIATDNDKPCGILTEFDVIGLYDNKAITEETLLSQVMISPVKTTPEHTPVPVALDMLLQNNIRHLIVVNDKKQVVGLVTEHDIVGQIEIEFAGKMRSEQKVTQTELRRYESQLHAIFDTTNIFLTLLDPKGRILELNEAVLKMSGFTRAGALNSPLWETVWRSDDLTQKQNLQRVIRDACQGLSSQLDTVHTDALQHVHYCDCHFQPIMGEDGEVEYILVEGLDVTDLKISQQQLKHLAFYDPLTNLPNRALLSERMQQALKQTLDTGQMLAIGYLDLDHFKPVNDTFGHDAGDQLLIEVAHRLQNASRHNDTIARLGGDEFVLLLPELESHAQAEDVIKRILAKVAAPYHIEGHNVSISASIGLTLYPHDNCDADRLLRHADQAMYCAKQQGRNQFFLFDNEKNNAMDSRLLWIQQAAHALENGEFLLLFQPKVNMRTGQVIGSEALLRWQHPEKGLLLPNQFLPELQGDPLMALLDDWVLEQSMLQLDQWHLQGLTLSVGVNISGQQLQESGFVEKIRKLLARHPRLPSGMLELEILENTALENISEVGNIISQCRALGVGFALDDFGTGYSSLIHLKRLPADTIKIDCSFIRDIMDDPDDLAIVEGIIGLANAFRLKVIAEGVEDTAQGLMLLHLGCSVAQGFGISSPITAEQLPTWVQQYKADPAWHSTTSVRLPTKNFPLLAASVDHRSWVSRIMAYINGETAEIMPDDSLNHSKCRFGTWFNNEGYQQFGGTPHWQEIDTIHKAIHAQANQMLAMVKQNESETARSQVPSLIEKRDKLLILLSQWYEDLPQAV